MSRSAIDEIRARVERALKAEEQAGAGARERVGASDHLDIRTEAAPRVICIACKRHIYYLRREADGSFGFAPLEGSGPVRRDLLCPKCGGRLCGFAAGQPVIKTDQGFI